MMTDLGNEVYLYAGQFNEAPCTEHVCCITDEQRKQALGDLHYTQGTFNAQTPHWQTFINNSIREIDKRSQAGDYLCLIGGTSHKPIADALPHLVPVEFGIGYPGTFAPFRVFESYAWMHTVYGSANSNPGAIDGRFYDAVIPSYFEAESFPLGAGDGDYLLFVGRLIERKGYHIAQMVAEHLGQRLLIAGHGDVVGYGEHVGVVDAQRRAELMGGASAMFAPTIYIEPFGSVVPEAQMCGTPSITTDWGAFTETVQDGVNGYRCHTLGQFVQAAIDAPKLDRAAIHNQAHATYSLEAVAVLYDRYFHRLETLRGAGWYTILELI
jgi:glycosyltransferase involved in cell wall biosynthesis